MFQKIRDIKALLTVVGYWDRIRKESESVNSKHLFLSKTFWLNVVGIVTTVAGILPQKYAVPVLAVANIIMRLLTNQPASLL